MKVLHLNYSDIAGGAARAAYRIHHALRASGVDSQMCVNEALAGDWTVEGPVSTCARLTARLRPQLAKPLRATLRSKNSIIHSPAFLPSSWAKRLNSSDADVIHLHWVAGEMLSIADIGRIEKPIVWTLHDMWAFCGAEHYTDDARWRDGYRRDNRPAHESGFDLNRWTWRRKRKHWGRPMHIVGDSNWIARCASESLLMRDWPCQFIYYPLDLEIWTPIKKRDARTLLGLPLETPLLAFGAMGGRRDPRKGFDLLLKALGSLRGRINDLELVVFGQLAPQQPLDLGFPTHYAGHLYDDLSLRAVYSAADMLVVPSRNEAFGQTASEAHACGTPVVAFDIGGLPDTVDHLLTGYLAKPFDVYDLAAGIQWVLDSPLKDDLGKLARAKAEKYFDPAMVAKQYIDVYEKALLK
ncbi:glycosyl transferase, group 1 [Luminiphilus syltensis NOR5-1B]|uniref:Glycosyl transferase, group 1 n=1 Tax=Luminiphilus syltensis NOR5-1B TaxID=565045 RepID=B8KUZ7_9GAMM|nr:glycosyltransferase family 4 protein [Luminiphilus syltensis]EED36626.1 glycosyl transferase, group 1 [Luminiphilus syltensis NOR5-1B]